MEAACLRPEAVSQGMLRSVRVFLHDEGGASDDFVLLNQPVSGLGFFQREDSGDHWLYLPLVDNPDRILQFRQVYVP